MKRLPFNIAFAAVAVVAAIVAPLPAFGEDVPFAERPPLGPGQSSAVLPSLGDIMGTTQMRHIKLWYAIKSKNWALLNYELGQIKDSFDNAVIFYRNIPVEYIISVEKPLVAMREAGKAKDSAKLEAGYADLTSACNSCHQAAEVGFILIQTPTYSPFSDQKFRPAQK